MFADLLAACTGGVFAAARDRVGGCCLALVVAAFDCLVALHACLVSGCLATLLTSGGLTSGRLVLNTSVVAGAERPCFEI